ncbi:Lipoprotein OS=Streptomyces fumanus OX=67302 GN=GCM10018772_01220 PE=4 SV=1 [Streptomyces fumanus]
MALRVEGALGRWVGVWRPAERQVHHLPAPDGWLAGAGLWTAQGVLRLPYATAETPCGVAALTPPPLVEAAPGPEPREPLAEQPASEPPPPAAPRPVPLQQAPLGRRVTN